MSRKTNSCVVCGKGYPDLLIKSSSPIIVKVLDRDRTVIEPKFERYLCRDCFVGIQPLFQTNGVNMDPRILYLC